jgi:hypothetical protein
MGKPTKKMIEYDRVVKRIYEVSSIAEYYI